MKTSTQELIERIKTVDNLKSLISWVKNNEERLLNDISSNPENKFEKVSMIQIPQKYLTKGILKALEGRESFKDTDLDLDEKIYTGDIFEAILCENSEIDDGNLLKLDNESMKQLEELSKEVDSEYVQIISI